MQGEPECVYTEGRLPAEDNLVTGDSRRQMGQFCGQHTYCDRWSSYIFIVSCIFVQLSHQFYLT